MHRTIASLLLLAIGAAAKLVPLAPFPGKDVLGSTFWGGPTSSVINNKIYLFGGSYAIPYVVDPNDFDRNPMFGFMDNDRYNVSNEVYSYDMQTDQWEFETTTPYPLKRGETLAVGDTVYFFNNNFESNDTRTIDMWTYHTVDKTWAHINRIPFVWRGHLMSCERDGKIFMTGSDDGRQISQIHIYDIESNSWEKDVITVDAQFQIMAMRCLDNRSVWIVGKTIGEDWYSGSIIDGKIEARQMETARVYADGSVTMGELTFEYHTLDRVAVADGHLYLLDRNGDEIFLSKIELGTHERFEITTIESTLAYPLMVPYGDELFLLGGNSNSYMHAKEDIRKFLHKYVAETQPIVEE
ncbi:hypothetical protein BJV82DRAFT_587257 [Fennellomyces sp. T-0311]|nr:hypothetical protein BJV82DRAFT_587257 [Fennellomyces sp. T-0311]